MTSPAPEQQPTPPDCPPAFIKRKPGERQLWRVLNASAITYLNLAVLFGHTPQPAISDLFDLFDFSK